MTKNRHAQKRRMGIPKCKGLRVCIGAAFLDADVSLG